jgi:hypothetical protein
MGVPFISMAKIGNYEAPYFKFSTILKGTEILIETLGGNVSEEKNFVTALGYNSKNGAYLGRVSDMRKYGLLSDRGIGATELANKIFKPLTQKEKKEAINEAINNIGLWKELIKRIGKKAISEENFRLQLAEITGDRDKAFKNANAILTLYKDILNYHDDNLSKDTETYISNKEDKNRVSLDNMEQTQAQVLEPKKILLKFEGNNVLLDRNDTNIGILINVLEGLKENKTKK